MVCAGPSRGGDTLTQRVLDGHEVLHFSLSSICFASFWARPPTPLERRCLFAPLLVLGAQRFYLWRAGPPRHGDPTSHAVAFAVVGMAAIFTAVVRAPLTGMISSPR